MSPLGYDPTGVLLALTRPGAVPYRAGAWVDGFDAQRAAAALQTLAARGLATADGGPTHAGRAHAEELRAAGRSPRPAARVSLDDLSAEEDQIVRERLASLYDDWIRGYQCTVGGGLGPDAHTLGAFWTDSRGLRVERLTPAAAASQKAWHTYCAAHGYRPTDHGPDAPPKPSTERRDELHLTWPQLGDWLHRPRGGEQLDLF